MLEKCEKEGNRILYTGQQYDTATEQYYLRARYYNPQLGRFLQEDPYLGDGLNLYIYCRNNSVVYYDPSGYATTEEILSYFNSQNNSSAIRSSNNSWNSFSQAVGGQGYSSSEIQEAYHVMMGSKNGHYLNRSYLHQSTKDAIDSIRVSGLPNIGYQEAKNRGYQVDIGHKNGYEYWRTRNAAENLGWSQAQYNDYMNSNPKEFYQFEEHYLNISHVDECHDSDVSKLQEAMERYQREQEGSGRWKKGGDNDYEMKERNC